MLAKAGTVLAAYADDTIPRTFVASPQKSNREIIVDTKFYALALNTGAFGTANVSLANLDQLFMYLRQRAAESGREQAEDVLLYSRTTRDCADEFTTHGHRIRALMLDLAGP